MGTQKLASSHPRWPLVQFLPPGLCLVLPDWLPGMIAEVCELKYVFLLSLLSVMVLLQQRKWNQSNGQLGCLPPPPESQPSPLANSSTLSSLHCTLQL